MQNKNDVKPIENVEKKLQKTWTMIYFGSQNDPENWAS